PDGKWEDAFEQAISLYEEQPLVFERARTRLAYGERLRRAGRRRDCRTHLHTALGELEGLGAFAWAERARVELRATGETGGPREAPETERLTPQELQIANLVADGHTNKEIAARLYLSPKTIEYHLSNTYRKLDVHSRAELASIVAERRAPAPADAPAPLSR